MSKKQNRRLKAVDFFCGGGGMSYGLKKAGIKVLAGIDYEENCRATYETNIKGAKFLNRNVFEYQAEELEEELKLDKDDDDLILIGCSPCQFWSTIQSDKKKSAKSKNLLFEFQRFVEHFNPGYVIVENVPGVLRRKKESGLDQFIDTLEQNGYVVHCDIHNISNYGVAQKRKRLTLIANRISDKELSPIKAKGKTKTVKDVIGEHNGFQPIEAGTRDESDLAHTSMSLSPLNLERIQLVKKNGGDRFAFANNPRLQLACFIGKDNSFKDTYGRISWDDASPTITTKFMSISNGRFGHPEENRGLSLREGASLQSFPINYKFKTTNISAAARIIGNAVPPEYAKRIGKAIMKS